MIVAGARDAGAVDAGAVEEGGAGGRAGGLVLVVPRSSSRVNIGVRRVGSAELPVPTPLEFALPPVPVDDASLRQGGMIGGYGFNSSNRSEGSTSSVLQLLWIISTVGAGGREEDEAVTEA